MSTTSGKDSTETITMLQEAVEQHRNGASPNDDLTLLCLKVKKGE